MRKVLVGAAFLLPMLPATAALAAAVPDAPAAPVFVDLGRGVDGNNDPADPTANHQGDEIFMGELARMGLALNGTDGAYVYLQVGEEGEAGSLGRVGAGITPTGVQVYAEDYTENNLIATVAAPVLDLLSDDASCPAAGAAACDAALVTVIAPATETVPSAPIELPDNAADLGDSTSLGDVVEGVGTTVGGLVGGLLGG